MNSRKALHIHVIEDHDDALYHIHRAIGSKVVGFEKNTMLHFDAHPDLLWPHDLTSDDLNSPNTVTDRSSIESWILPLVAKGHVDTVVWLKPAWSNQLDDGFYDCVVGNLKGTADIRISCAESYFLSELIYAPRHEIEHSFPLHLYVVTFDNKSISSNPLWIEILGNVDCKRNLLLDIDLDYFSTHNPFKEGYPTTYHLFQELFEYKRPLTDDLEVIKLSQSDHGQRICKLKKEFSECNCSRNTSSEVDERMLLIIDKLRQQACYDDDIYATILDTALNYASGCDDKGELPHNKSTFVVVDEMVRHVCETLRSCEITPQLITIARSAEDGFCPNDQVEYIETKVLDELMSIYPGSVIDKHYN